MSLKAIHIVFIASAILLSFFFGGWGFHHYLHGGGPIDLVYGVGSSACGVGLIYYGKSILRKLKDISYL